MTILSGVVKQNSNGRQQTLTDLFKDLVAGAKNSAVTSSPKYPEKAKPDFLSSSSANVQTTTFQANEFLSRQGVSNLTARWVNIWLMFGVFYRCKKSSDFNHKFAHA